MVDPGGLLDVGDLKGVRVGISVSESTDLASRGLTEAHLRLVLGEIARTMLLARACLVYGGRLDPEGYTAFLQQELQKYGRRDQPLSVCLAYSEHRILPLAELREAGKDLGLYGRIIYLDIDGEPIAVDHDREDEPTEISEADRHASLSSLRRFMSENTDARVLIGGRREGFEGRMPGLLEEARLSIERNQPVFFAGGFGGMTGDIGRKLGLDPADALPPTPDSTLESQVEEALEELNAAVEESGWSPERNGLNALQNRQLAASHRPGEVASLVSIGLRRLRAQGQLPDG